MNSNPVIIDSATCQGRMLKRVEVSSGDHRDEKWLQELLYEHPELLPIDEFDETFSPAIPLGREVRSGRGPIDNLYISPSGRITIVETKLWKNPEKHRTVVAQIIDYAKELARWNYDDLDRAISAISQSRGDTRSSLGEKVENHLRENSISLIEFQENVQESLECGNFLLLIVGDRIAPNVAMLTEAIHSAPHLRFQLGLVEMRLHPLTDGKDWPLLVVPDVVGRTVEKARGVIEIRFQQEKPNVSATFETDEPKPPKKVFDAQEFLGEISKDFGCLEMTFREAMAKWESLGGVLDCTNRMVNFAMALNCGVCQFIRCMTFQIQLITLEKFSEWSEDASIYEQYLQQLNKSEVIGNIARNGGHWISYKKINAEDLRALLNAGMFLAESIRSAGK